MNMARSLRFRPPPVLSWVPRRSVPTFQTRRYTSQTLLPDDSQLSETALPNGQSYSLQFARFPSSAGDSEPSTACLLWGDTKTALIADGFNPAPLPAPSRPAMCRIALGSVAWHGVFASQDIERGETIIVERPFLLAAAQLPGDLTPEDPQYDTLGMALLGAMDTLVTTRLSDSERADFFSLFSTDGSIYNILSQNAIAVADPLPGSYTGQHKVLGRDVSRINHSCTPNVELTWDPASFTVSIHSKTRIAQGEELFLSYSTEPLERSERLQMLSEHYEFDCTCPLCSLPDDQAAESDTRRRLIAEDLKHLTEAVLGSEDAADDAVFAAWLADRSLPDDHITAHSANIIQMMDVEFAGEPLQRIMHYMRLTRAYIALANEERAKHWTERIMSVRDPRFAEILTHFGTTSAREEEEWGLRKRDM
ncbi:hypothetical protein C8R46DRAFT_996914 [Mycena filopes]|nr:hypothetical protein C8R46DRAFT_996914 [Mycena filopes]